MWNWLQDVRYATRQFFKSPGFALGAIVSLMLGIGATTTIFSVVYGVLLNPFPYRDAKRIAYVRVSDKTGENSLRVNGSQFEAIRKASLVEDVFFQRAESKTLTGEKYPIVLNAGFYTPNALDFLGVPPLFGRVFTPADAIGENPAPVAVLSYRFWKEHYFKSHEVIGKTIELDSVLYTIIGVMPPRFTWFGSDVYLPGIPTADSHPLSLWMVFPKLKSGANHQAAEAEFQVLVDLFAKETLDSYQQTSRVKLVSLYDDALGSAGGTVANLFAAAVVLLIIACENVSILLLARGRARQHELAVRASLGADRLRLIRQLLTESVLLFVIGTTLGVLLAWWGVSVARTMLPYASLPSEVVVQLNLPVLLFSAVVAVITGVLFGLSPAFELSQSPHLSSVLQAGSTRVAGSFRARRMHRLPIAGQVALTLLLLTGAGAAAKALLAKVNSLQGFDPDHVFCMPVRLPIKAITKQGEVRPDGIQELITEEETVRSAVAQAPGVAEAGLSPVWYPGLIANDTGIEIKSKPSMTDSEAVVSPISPQLLSVLRIPLLRGRIFDGLEVQRQAHVAVVNQAFLKQYLGGVDPIGQHIRVPYLKQGHSSLSDDDWMEVIGVVGDATNDSVEHPRVRPAVFIPSSLRSPTPGVMMFVRANGDPETVIRSVRARLHELDPDVLVVYARTLQSDLPWEWARERLITTILSLYGVVALILAATGLFSVVSFAVTQRTQEVGIRLALGAGRISVARLVLSSTAAMFGIGLLAGLILSAILSPLVSTWGAGHLFQPLKLLEAALILALVAAIACAVPVWRATSIDPIKVLRTE